ncbi:MAG: hypothetical protein VYB77_05485 [Planctomycetota bacterium]|nr:hypothetical protein [Planctomycetota bacterium]
MTNSRQANRAAFTPILLAAALTAMLGGCDGSSPSPDPGPTTATIDPRSFQEGLDAVEVWLGRGDAVKAEVVAGRLVELDPGSHEALQAHGRCLLILGATAERSGREDAARVFRDRAADRYLEAVEAAGEVAGTGLLHEAGVAATGARRLTLALELHQRAAALDGTDATHAIFAANVLTMMDRPREAAPWFERAIETAPDEPWGWAGRAECLRQLERYEEALVAVRSARQRAITRGTESGFPFRVAEARILREAGRPGEAANLLFAIRADEHTLGSTRELAAACAAMDRHAKAAEAWERYNRGRPDDTASMLEAARCWMMAGEPQRAAAWLDLAESSGVEPAELDPIRSMH